MNLTEINLAELAWAQLWQVTLLAIVVAVVVHLAARARPHLAYLLWMLVIIKCLTPPVWSSSASLFSWAQLHVEAPVSRDLADQPAGDPPGWLFGDAMDGEQPLSGSAAQTHADVISVQPVTIRLPALLAAIWLAGASVLALLVLAKWLRSQALLQSSATEVDPAIGRLIENLSRRLSVRSKVRVVVTSAPVGPAVYGWWRATIVLPEALLAAKSPEEIELLLAHELVHVRRGDTLAGPLQLVAQIVWWFHPLIWWTNRQIRRARERCADQEVVTRLACRPTRYARSLLEAVELLGPLRHEPLSSGVHLSNITVTRLEEIMNHADRFCRRTPVAYWMVLVVAGVLVLPGAGLTLSASPQASAETEAGASDEAADPTNDNSRAADAERDAEAALKDLGARIERDGDEVVYVSLRDNRQITDADLVYLTKLPWRKTRGEVEFSTRYSYGPWPSPALNLANTEITDAGVEHLKQLTNLRMLHLDGTEITDAGLEHLKGLTSLERLVLYNTKITDAGLVHLKGLTSLVWLKLKGTEITDAGLVHLKALTSLEFLWLYGTDITDEGLVHLKDLTNLEGLGLQDTEITDAGLVHLNGLTNLKGLWLNGTEITDAGLVHLKGLTSLERLGLGGTEITDAGLVHLKGLASLETLGLSGTEITDAGLVHLKGLTSLEWLGLNNTEITDAGLAYLKGLTSLEELKLKGTDVSDAGLVQLKGLKKLMRLNLQGTEVTDEGVSKLQEALPNCKIEFP